MRRQASRENLHSSMGERVIDTVSDTLSLLFSYFS